MTWERTTRRSPVAWSEQPSGWRKIDSVDLHMCNTICNICLQITWSLDVLSFHPAVENLLLLLCCQPACILRGKVLQDGHCLIVRAELIGQASYDRHCFAKHLFGFSNTVELGGIDLLSQAGSAKLSFWEIEGEMDPGKGNVWSHQNLAEGNWNSWVKYKFQGTWIIVYRKNAPCSSQRSTAQWSNIAEERLLPTTQFVEKYCLLFRKATWTHLAPPLRPPGRALLQLILPLRSLCIPGNKIFTLSFCNVDIHLTWLSENVQLKSKTKSELVSFNKFCQTTIVQYFIMKSSSTMNLFMHHFWEEEQEKNLVSGNVHAAPWRLHCLPVLEIIIHPSDFPRIRENLP